MSSNPKLFDPYDLVSTPKVKTEITLRDLFAMAALNLGGQFMHTVANCTSHAEIAAASYGIADAMLAERAKGSR